MMLDPLNPKPPKQPISPINSLGGASFPNLSNQFGESERFNLAADSKHWPQEVADGALPQAGFSQIKIAVTSNRNLVITKQQGPGMTEISYAIFDNAGKRSSFCSITEYRSPPKLQPSIEGPKDPPSFPPNLPPNFPPDFNSNSPVYSYSWRNRRDLLDTLAYTRAVPNELTELARSMPSLNETAVEAKIEANFPNVNFNLRHPSFARGPLAFMK